MGLHIRKSLGYALTGLRSPGGDLTDPRVNAASWLLDHDLPTDGTRREQDRDSVALVQTSLDTAALVLGDPTSTHPWIRTADPIDHAEAVAGAHGPDATVMRLERGIDIYAGLVMDRRTGAQVGHEHRLHAWLALKNPDIFEHLIITDRHGNPLFTSGAELAENLVPAVPQPIRDLAERGELFPDPGTWLQLRPVLCTDWI